MFLDNLKLKDLKKYYKNEKDAIKQAIINELNRCYRNSKKRFLYVKELAKIDDYFKVEVIYIDYFTSIQVKDTGIYYIHKEVI